MALSCRWCKGEIEAPAKAHVNPPCSKAPLYIKHKWEKEAVIRQSIQETLDIIDEEAGKAGQKRTS